MNNQTFEQLLAEVQKPGRYLGNEWNVVKKDLHGVDVKFALCFPEVYELAMSHLGVKILYHLLNERPDIACERVFAPGLDLEGLLRKYGLPLFSLESKSPLKNFDIVGFSLTYEMTFTNVLNMMELGGIPVWSSQRTSGDPLVIMGGVAAFNPEPMSGFADLFVIGEAEEVIFELIDSFKIFRHKVPREELLKILSGIPGIYVPSLYNAEYNADGTLKDFYPIDSSAPRRIEKRIVKDLDKAAYPTKQIVPFIKIVHDRISLEIMRGCPHRCRFCQAWVIYHNRRQRSLEKLLELSAQSQRLTGYEEISLLSLSSGDYPDIEQLIAKLVEIYASRGVCVSLPSLRIDKRLKEFPAAIRKAGITGFTFAPEAGSSRLRDIINKKIDISALEEAIVSLREAGWKRAKLYFMIGLPGENEGDIDSIADIAQRLKGNMTLSISTFIPKPHTPFQWASMQSLDYLSDKCLYLKNKTGKTKRIKLDFHNPQLSFLEAVFSRGDRKIGSVIYSAFKNGSRFDGWQEHFNFDNWVKAFSACGINPDYYAYRKKSYAELLPWDHIGAGISKEFLIKESECAYSLS